MPDVISKEYRGWTIELVPDKKFACSNFAMTLKSPEGTEKHVPAAGDSEDRAMERGREMIDMEHELGG